MNRNSQYLVVNMHDAITSSDLERKNCFCESCFCSVGFVHCLKFRKCRRKFFSVVPTLGTSWFLHRSPRQSGTYVSLLLCNCYM